MAGGFSESGESRAINSLEQAPERFRIGLAQASQMGGQVLVRTVQRGILSPPKSGRVYGGHQASAPGEYSANKSGNLLGAADYELSGANFLHFGFRPSAGHAVYQELGTSRMAPRPNLGKAVEESSSEVQNLPGQVTFRRIVGG